MVGRIRHTFTMRQEPGDAQAMFVRDIAPDLHRLRGFTLYKNEPGELAFGDGRDLVAYNIGERGGAVMGPSRLMRRLTERRVRASFDAVPEGTLVTLRGGAEGDVCKALALLGQSGQWPEKAPSPGR
jgi:hypothetical protein